MVSALDSSESGRVKAFCNEGVLFGWDTIKRMWQRELERAQRGVMSEVPKLRERHIKRDAWTRLNVSTAKIMQVVILWDCYFMGVSCVHSLTTHFSHKRTHWPLFSTHTHTHTHTHAHTLQQVQVLSKIEKHGAVHSKSDEMTLHYLKALNNIFERGVLCREHISSSNQTVLDRMEKVLIFFPSGERMSSIKVSGE